MKRLFLLLSLFVLTLGRADAYVVKQSSTQRPLLFLMLDSIDHISAKTGLTPTVTLSKNGAAFGAPAGAVSEIGSGWYQVAANATDDNTLGVLLLHATATGADACDTMFEIVAYDPQDSAALGLTRVDAAVSSRMATFTLPTNFSSLAITGGGAVTAGTVSDKTGYSLAQTFPTNFSSLSIDGLGRIDLGKWLGTAPAALSTNGYVQGMLLRWLTDNAGGTPNALAIGRVDSNPGAYAATPPDTSGTTTLLTRIPGTVQPQTGDSYARLGAPAGASLSADVAANLTAINTRAATSALPTNFSALSITAGGLVAINLAQALGASPWDTTTIGDSFKAGWTQGVGKWVISATAHTLTLYAPDGTTALKTFAILPVPTVNASRQ